MLFPSAAAIREESDRLLANDCQVDKRGHPIDIVPRLHGFRQRYAVWEGYFASVANVFDSRQAARLNRLYLTLKIVQSIELVDPTELISSKLQIPTLEEELSKSLEEKTV